MVTGAGAGLGVGAGSGAARRSDREVVSFFDGLGLEVGLEGAAVLAALDGLTIDEIDAATCGSHVGGLITIHPNASTRSPIRKRINFSSRMAGSAYL